MQPREERQQGVPEDLARDLYALHADRLGGKNFRGHPIPAYEDLSPEARQWWVKDVDAALAPVARAVLYQIDYGPPIPPTP